MPKLCKYENCRLRAVHNYCGIHHQISNVPIEKCSHTKDSAHLFKGYCCDCYIANFPYDPLTFQMKYKNKMVATYEFIHNRFDGFASFEAVSNISNRGICINDTLLLVCCVSEQSLVHITSPKYISVVFNTDKYKCSKTGKMVNPMLYRRLPLLEDAINRQIEFILAKNLSKEDYPDFIKINYHL